MSEASDPLLDGVANPDVAGVLLAAVGQHDTTARLDALLRSVLATAPGAAHEDAALHLALLWARTPTDTRRRMACIAASPGAGAIPQLPGAEPVAAPRLNEGERADATGEVPSQVAARAGACGYLRAWLEGPWPLAARLQADPAGVRTALVGSWAAAQACLGEPRGTLTATETLRAAVAGPASHIEHTLHQALAHLQGPLHPTQQEVEPLFGLPVGFGAQLAGTDTAWFPPAMARAWDWARALLDHHNVYVEHSWDSVGTQAILALAHYATGRTPQHDDLLAHLAWLTTDRARYYHTVCAALQRAHHNLDQATSDPVSLVWAWLHREWPTSEDPGRRWDGLTRGTARSLPYCAVHILLPWACQTLTRALATQHDLLGPGHRVRITAGPHAHCHGMVTQTLWREDHDNETLRPAYQVDLEAPHDRAFVDAEHTTTC